MIGYYNYTVILKDLFLDNYNEDLDKIKDYEIGTAGSSLKCAIVASAFLNCTEQNELSKQENTDNTINVIINKTEASSTEYRNPCMKKYNPQCCKAHDLTSVFTDQLKRVFIRHI